MTRVGVDISPIWDKTLGITDRTLFVSILNTFSSVNIVVVFILEINDSIYEVSMEELENFAKKTISKSQGTQTHEGGFLDLELKVTKVEAPLSYLLYDEWWVVGNSLSMNSMERITYLKDYLKCGLIIRATTQFGLGSYELRYDPTSEYCFFNIIPAFNKIIRVVDKDNDLLASSTEGQKLNSIRNAGEDDWIYFYSKDYGLAVRTSTHSIKVFNSSMNPIGLRNLVFR